ncbi:hypothetical protein DPMN_068305 [Dreissena polymorpha]|uniref:Uncharacterized protein n=1 Tax=Dreissena polymorpha TaxID=45954 RepID=A0A9D3Z1D9_DREPO|nr:hypothetical protein DPMN_068305 [Dreissena polymorpha]
MTYRTVDCHNLKISGTEHRKLQAVSRPMLYTAQKYLSTELYQAQNRLCPEKDCDTRAVSSPKQTMPGKSHENNYVTQTASQTDRQTDRQAYIQTDRKTNS